MSSLRAVYNRWMPAGTPGHDAKMFADVHTRVVSQTKRALRGWQMEKVLAGGRTGNPIAKPADRLHITGQAALDYFRLMFLCRGMPFIDLAHLRKRDLQGRYLVYLRHKTRCPMRVELCPEALRLLRKYGKENPDSPYLLPILDADTSGGWGLYKDYQDALRLFNRDLARAMEFLLPGVRVSSYTARHTWATLAYHMGLPLGVISQSLGHASIRVTETYLKPFENERLDKANKQLIATVKKGKWKKFANNNIL
ncbi:tyrosine-type recombinase/integrase [Bacteroides intestinalis]|nr:tyrosine-type recombinase/integrase [Bacteroides intestinalis]